MTKEKADITAKDGEWTVRLYPLRRLSGNIDLDAQVWVGTRQDFSVREGTAIVCREIRIGLQGAPREFDAKTAARFANAMAVAAEIAANAEIFHGSIPPTLDFVIPVSEEERRATIKELREEQEHLVQIVAVLRYKSREYACAAKKQFESMIEDVWEESGEDPAVYKKVVVLRSTDKHLGDSAAEAKEFFAINDDEDANRLASDLRRGLGLLGDR